MHDLGTLGDIDSVGLGGNEEGAVVGNNYYDINHALLRYKGAVADLGTLVGPSGYSSALNTVIPSEADLSDRSRWGAWVGRARSFRLRGERSWLDFPNAVRLPDHTSPSFLSAMPWLTSGRRT